jgi:hypothetical protein
MRGRLSLDGGSCKVVKLIGATFIQHAPQFYVTPHFKLDGKGNVILELSPLA